VKSSREQFGAEQRNSMGDDADDVPVKRTFKKQKSMLTAAFRGVVVEQALSAIKQESQAYAVKGAGHYFKVDGAMDMDEVKKLQHPYLDASEARAYDDADGAQLRDAGKAYESLMEEVDGFSSDTGTIPMDTGGYNAFLTYIDLASRLKVQDTPDKDGKPSIKIDSIDDKNPGKAKKGGFAGGYDHVNVPCFSEAEQNRVLFGYTRTSFQKIAGPKANLLLSAVTEQVAQKIKKPVKLVEAHVLFHWNGHSFFKYHTDNVGTWTLVVMLTPGVSTFHMAGFPKNATFDKPGSAHLFQSKMAHRSDRAPRRTVKMTFFFVEETVIDLAVDEKALPAPDPPQEAPADVKETVVKEGGASSSS
jgi:hypothetical protein